MWQDQKMREGRGLSYDFFSKHLELEGTKFHQQVFSLVAQSQGLPSLRFQHSLRFVAIEIQGP